MAWFGAAYATNDPSSYDYSDRNKFFGGSASDSAAQLNQQLGGQQNAAAVGQQTQMQAQGNAFGLANTQRGGRGNAMLRSAMMQAPAARQAGTQAQYAQQQANFQNAQNAQQFEADRRAAVEQKTLGEYKADNNQALQNQRETVSTIDALAGISKMAGAAAASDERMKNVLGGKKMAGYDCPSVIIMVGGSGIEDIDDDDDDDDEPDDAGGDAVEAMRELEPATFEYKPEFKNAPGAGPGEYTGIMAQDLEKTPAGRGTVMKGPDGMRRVDGAKLSTLNSAALSQVIKDVDKLKGDRRG